MADLLSPVLTFAAFGFIYDAFVMKDANRIRQRMVLKEKLQQMEQNYITELEERVEERTQEIVRIMNTDIVTGLYNRRYLEDYLVREGAALGINEGISLLYIELNKYNSIKSLYGVYVAEALLQECGSRISSVIAESGLPALIASYSEDIFVITIKAEEPQEQSLAIAKDIINKCIGRYHIERYDIVVALNIGSSCYPYDTLTYEDLIKNAASAMKHSRKKGDNQYFHFNETIGRYDFIRNNIEIELKKVEFDKDFRLFYQPQVSCDSGELIGAEALLRWQTKAGTYIPPNEFIPIAEESGQIIPLGYWVIENAVKQLVKWRKHSDKELRIAVNVSVIQLNENDFVSRINGILNKYRISPQNFEIEITENIPLDGNTEVLDNLVALRKLGISIAIDDFGTGYSSLYYLKNLPMDRIKIAKVLIDNIEKDPYSHSIIRMVIDMVKSNGIKVIAEGVESKEQWECLMKLHCDEIQGYYFAKPMPEQELIQGWLMDKAI